MFGAIWINAPVRRYVEAVKDIENFERAGGFRMTKRISTVPRLERNERLAVYRDNERPTFVAREFRTMIDQMPELTTYMPDMRRYLLEYPKVTLAHSTSFLYWQETVFGLKPTIRTSHLTIREGPDDTVVTSKMLYARHYFWTGSR